MTADVTIIIPTHNRLWSLPKAIDSCRQDGLNLEIIVIDDGSTDGTWSWLERQSNLIALRQENLGKAWAVNRAFSTASGKYVRILDSDDWYHEDVLLRQFQLAESEKADLVTGGYSTWLDEHRLMRKQNWIACDDFIAQQLGECDSSHYSAYLFSRQFIADIPHRPEFSVLDDRLFILEVALRHLEVAVFEPPALAIRHHQGPRLQFASGMRGIVTNYQHLHVYRRIIGKLEQQGELSLRRKRAAIRILWPLAHRIAYTNPEEAREVVQWIHQMDSDFVPPERGLLGQLYRRLGFWRTEEILRLRRRAMRWVPHALHGTAGRPDL